LSPINALASLVWQQHPACTTTHSKLARWLDRKSKKKHLTQVYLKLGANLSDDLSDPQLSIDIFRRHFICSRNTDATYSAHHRSFWWLMRYITLIT